MWMRIVIGMVQVRTHRVMMVGVVICGQLGSLRGPAGASGRGRRVGQLMALDGRRMTCLWSVLLLLIKMVAVVGRNHLLARVHSIELLMDAVARNKWVLMVAELLLLAVVELLAVPADVVVGGCGGGGGRGGRARLIRRRRAGRVAARRLLPVAALLVRGQPVAGRRVVGPRRRRRDTCRPRDEVRGAASASAVAACSATSGARRRARGRVLADRRRWHALDEASAHVPGC